MSLSGSYPIPHAGGSRDAALRWAGIIAAAAVMGVMSVRSSLEAILIAVVLAVGSVLLIRAGDSHGEISFRWVPVAWVALMFASDHHFLDLYRSPLDAAAGKASLENLVELTVYAVVAAMVIRSRHLLLRRAPWKVPKGPLLLFPALALMSVMWSTIGLFTLIRASQLLVIAGLALLVVRIWQLSEDVGRSVWRATLSSFVQITTILSIIGLLFPAPVSGRFSWPGTHPGVAAAWVGVAALVLVVGGRSYAPAPRWAYWPRLVIFAAMFNLALTRSAFVAIAFVGLVALWDMGRERPIARYLGVWYYAVGALLLAVLLEARVATYLSRGDTEETVFSLSGRIPLWETAIDALVGAGRMVVGFGYGAARVVLYPRVSWAGTAHNSWIEALLGVGILGVVVLAVTVSFLLWRLAVAGRPSRSTRLALCILAFLLVVSMTSEALVEPGFGFGLLALISVPALSEWKRLPGVRIGRPRQVSLPVPRDRGSGVPADA